MTAALAIDPGSCTGWAIRTGDGRVVFGTWRLVNDTGGRLNDLVARIDAAQVEHGFERIAYETPFFARFATAARVLFHLEGQILVAYSSTTPR